MLVARPVRRELHRRSPPQRACWIAGNQRNMEPPPKRLAQEENNERDHSTDRAWQAWFASLCTEGWIHSGPVIYAHAACYKSAPYSALKRTLGRNGLQQDEVPTEGNSMGDRPRCAEQRGSAICLVLTRLSRLETAYPSELRAEGCKLSQLGGCGNLLHRLAATGNCYRSGYSTCFANHKVIRQTSIALRRCDESGGLSANVAVSGPRGAWHR
jgi:hypothetical protein